MRVLILLLAGIVCLCGTHAAAGATLDRDDNGDDVSVSFRSPFSDLPPGGCVPYEVTIRNDHNSAGTWRVTFQASATMAFVKLKCAIPPRFFTDYLSFLKVEGRWQIAQKVFATETRE